MKIFVQIDRLVLEGVAIAPSDRWRIAESVRTELTRLLLQSAPRLAAGEHGRADSAGPMVLGQWLSAEPLGRAIATAADTELRVALSAPAGHRTDGHD